ncbi:phage holin family protein, partial [Erwinia amylovora]|uniref:phage holin family protein n=1 Tax=Erwinia amylovora TaxID=552 RepID=UPI0020BDD63C
MILDGRRSGAVTLICSSALYYPVLPKSISIAIGCVNGFIGVYSFIEFSLRFIGNRFGFNDDNKR